MKKRTGVCETKETSLHIWHLLMSFEGCSWTLDCVKSSAFSHKLEPEESSRVGGLSPREDIAYNESPVRYSSTDGGKHVLQLPSPEEEGQHMRPHQQHALLLGHYYGVPPGKDDTEEGQALCPPSMQDPEPSWDDRLSNIACAERGL